MVHRLLYVFYTNKARCYTEFNKENREAKTSGIRFLDRRKENAMKKIILIIEQALEEYYESFAK